METGIGQMPYGIVPPNGNLILSTSTAANYFQAYKMNGTGPFNLVLYANKTGAYRITARYHLQGDGPNTLTIGTGPISQMGTAKGTAIRDAAIVVSPTKARSMVMYEVNAMYIDAEAPASGTDASTRSTFDYFDGGPNCPPNNTKRPFDLNYVKSLGVNWLWLQPIHPIGVQGRQLDPNNGNAPFSVGSPYAVKNFFAVNPLFSKTYLPGTTPEATGRANAMVEWKNFVKAADTAGVNIMLDVPFNHTSFDCEIRRDRGRRYSVMSPRRQLRNFRMCRRIFTRGGMARACPGRTRRRFKLRAILRLRGARL